MNSPKMAVGIEISKKHLDLARFPRRDRFTGPDNDDGLAKMLTKLKLWSPEPILLKASGGYEYVASPLCCLAVSRP